jgi:hypothetical protein
MDTLPNVTGGFFVIAGGLALLTAFVVFRAINAIRWHNQREFWLFLVMAIPLAVAAAGVFWIGHQKWYVNAFGNKGFGPNWQCTTSGGMGSEICIRKVQKPAATQTDAGRESH